MPVGFSWRNKILRCSAYDITESNPVPDRAQKLISSSMSRHLSTRKISSKSMHAFLSNLLTDRHTDRQASWAIAFTSSIVGGKLWLMRGFLHLQACLMVFPWVACKEAHFYCSRSIVCECCLHCTVPLQCLWRDSVTLISALLLTYNHCVQVILTAVDVTISMSQRRL